MLDALAFGTSGLLLNSLEMADAMKHALLAVTSLVCQLIPLAASATDPLSPTSIFAPASTPADAIFELSLFVLAVTGAIFVTVFGLLVYVVVRFRRRTGDDGSEPPQVYG